MARQGSPNLDTVSVLDARGGRKYVYPADVKGRWSRLKPWVYSALIAIYIALPFIDIGGNPAVLIDISKRQFFIFGATFNAQDFYLAFFVVAGIGIALIMAAGLYGRLWCGWACPQTVFLDGVFRRIERWIEGPAQVRKRLAEGPWTLEKIVKKTAKHLVYFVVAVVISHAFLAYFTGADALWAMIGDGPAEHLSTFIWGAVLTAIIYGNFWWFREQLCIVVCPYGRLQSVLQDRDTIHVIYDKTRGEPRGKAKDKESAGLGDCVDCFRCVVVCPTGIDIRNGHQLECIGCGYCADACDDVMNRLGRLPGLIRHDSLRMVEEGVRHFWRPRVFFYLALTVAGLAVSIFVMMRNNPFEAEVLRSSGQPFSIQQADDGAPLAVLNQARIHLVNKLGVTTTFTVAPTPESAPWVTLPQPGVRLEPFADHDLPVLIRVPAENWRRGIKVEFDVTTPLRPTARRVELDILGPNKLALPRVEGAP